MNSEPLDELIDPVFVLILEQAEALIYEFSTSIEAELLEEKRTNAKAKAEFRQKLLDWHRGEVVKAKTEQFNKSIEVMKDILAENFHYRTMCGEIRDPDGLVDVHQQFIRYQELEPERKKFAEYLEGVKAELNSLKKGKL